MSVFGDAMDVLADCPDLGTAGTFTPADGPALALRVILSRRDPAANVFQTGVRLGGWVADLKTLDVVDRPREGDTLVAAGRTFTIRDAELDVAGVSWRCDLDEVAA